MYITLNGETRPIGPDMTIASLLAMEALAERRVAVEVNGTIVPRAQHATHLLREGDCIEIVHALGGG